jgi:predicted Kef-type K+ transport protein
MRRTWSERLELTAFFLLLIGGVASLAFLCFRQFDTLWDTHLIISVGIVMLALVLLGLCVWLSWPQRDTGATRQAKTQLQ